MQRQPNRLQSNLKPVAPYDLKNPYFACFYGTIIAVARLHAANGIKTPVDFVFDEQGNLGAFVVLWYQTIKEWQDPSISAVLGSTPIFRDDKRVLPLQAADLLVWHLRRKKEIRNSSEKRLVMDEIFGNHVECTFTEQTLLHLAKQMSAVPGVKESQSKKSSIRRLLKKIK